jgi:GNAT superfamily N-acetyltransferase
MPAPGRGYVQPEMPEAATVEIRPITPEDKDALEEGFTRFSDQSRYMRFLAPHGRLTPAELRYFTEVDHHDHEALVAVDPVTGEGVGVARYIRSVDDPTIAEIAVAVVDEWHGRGIGTQLLTALSERARLEGIRSFSALCLAENDRMLNLLDDIGRVEVTHQELGTVEVIVDLPERGVERLRRLLAAVARGEIIPFPHFPAGRRNGAADAEAAPTDASGSASTGADAASADAAPADD